jgi:peptidoglycan/LPS O-acetylase OafA/YrhL
VPLSAASSAARFGPGAFRLFLAGMVVLHHAHLIALGTWAVFVFFTLSGYWVTGMWHQTYRRCRAPYATFIASRYWRLLPVYVVCYALTLLLLWTLDAPEWPALVSDHLARPEWIARLLLIASSSYQEVPLPPAWSLDVEMQFYLVLPVLAAVVGWAAARAPLVRSAALATLVVVGVGAYFTAPVGNYVLFFLAGIMIWQCNWHASRPLAAASALGVVAAVVALWWIPATHDVISGTATIPIDRRINVANDMMCAALAMAALPFAAYNVRMPVTGALDRDLGNLAYAVYLFHYLPKFVVDLTLVPRGWPWASVLAVDLVLVVIGSVTLYWFLDRPLDNWRKQWVRSRQVHAAGARTVRGQDTVAASATASGSGT